MPAAEDATGLPEMTENALRAARCDGNRTKSRNFYLWLKSGKEIHAHAPIVLQVAQWLSGDVKTVRYSPDALKSLRRYGNVAARARKAVEEYAAETGAHANNVTRLVGSTACRLRVGDFRVIFEESDTDTVVTKLPPRVNVYD